MSIAADRPPAWMAWLQLVRLPLLPSAIADATAAFLVGQQVLARGVWGNGSWVVLALVVAATSLMYLAGMALNDYFDYEIDLEERPQRPLPSGQIGRTTALALGLALLIGGVLLGAAAGVASGLLIENANPHAWLSGLLALLLAGAIVLYDGCAKQSWLGPPTMGACRGLNWLFGMSVGIAAADEPTWLGFTLAEALIAGGMALYVCGITLFAREEAEEESSLHTLLGGLALMLGGLALFAAHAWAAPFSETQRWWFLAAIAAIGFTIFRRALVATLNPQPTEVQGTVVLALRSLIILAAAVALFWAGIPWGLAVVALMLPALLLGRWLYST